MRNKTKDTGKYNDDTAARQSITDRETTTICTCNDDTELKFVPPNTSNIWQNSRVAILISNLLSGIITRLVPDINLSLKDGFSYPEADNLLETSGRTTFRILESLTEEGILCKDFFEKIFISPKGSIQMIPVERCPRCDSGDLTRGKMIEHFDCGYIGLEEEFINGMKHTCPKCSKELKLIGTDYRNPGMLYTCHHCHDIFPLPTIKFRCLKTREVYSSDELRHFRLYSFCLNEASKQRLEFELEPKKKFVDYLHNLGYNVQESVRLIGRSGATHKVDLLATIKNSIAEHTVAIGILSAPPDKEEVTLEELFSFDSEIYDIGLDYKIVLAIPRLAAEASKFAERQRIRVYGIEELRGLFSNLPLPQKTAADEIQWETFECEDESAMSKLCYKGLLKKLLEKKGYQVDENARIKGRSGAEHVFEFYATKDDGIISHKLAARIIVNEQAGKDDVNDIIQFDTAAYDAGIRDKVIIIVPELSEKAKQFAEYQRIRVLEARDLDDFSKKYLKTDLRLVIETHEQVQKGN